MAQKTSGLQRAFSIPLIYNLFNIAAGQKRAYTILIRDYIKPTSGAKILDIGCGTARILEYLPRDVEYTGFDISSNYIESAKQRYGHRGQFFCQRVSQAAIQETAYFDCALAIGVIHHLNDDEALQLFKIAHLALKPGGKLITNDGVFADRQSAIVKFLLRLDRGKNVRQEEGYQTLAKWVFSNVITDIRHDLARLPYTHCIMTAIK